MLRRTKNINKILIRLLCVIICLHKDVLGVEQLPVGILYGLDMHKYQEIFLHNS
nr:MAG TPA: hypothetical protein [Caudoviricetes sp.]